MAYAVTHVIVAIVLVDLYRDYIAKKKFSTHYVLIAGIAGLLPDLDFPLQMLANALFSETVQVHRVITHSLFFVGLFLALALVFHLQKSKKFPLWRWTLKGESFALFFTMIAVGWFTHIALDCSLAGDYFLTWFPGYPLGFCHPPFSADVLLGMDAVILVLWLIHEEWRHKIRDFI